MSKSKTQTATLATLFAATITGAKEAATRFGTAVLLIHRDHGGDGDAFRDAIKSEALSRLAAIDPETFNPETTTLTGKAIKEAVAGNDEATAVLTAFETLRQLVSDATATVARLTTKAGKVAKAHRAEWDAIQTGAPGAVTAARRAAKAPKKPGKKKPTTLVAARKAIRAELDATRKRVDAIVAGVTNAKSRAKVAKMADEMLAEMAGFLENVEV